MGWREEIDQFLTDEIREKVDRLFTEPEPAISGPSEGSGVNSYIRREDGTVWPSPDDPREVEWRLRYGTPSEIDRLYAASVIHAYRELCRSRSNAFIAGLRRELREKYPEPDQQR